MPNELEKTWGAADAEEERDSEWDCDLGVFRDCDLGVLRDCDLGVNEATSEADHKSDPLKPLFKDCWLPDKTAPVKEKCKTGMEVQFPGGYFLQNVWHPISCSMTRYTTEAEINGCLKGKYLHVIGDSTLLQYMRYCTNILPNLKDLNLYGSGWGKSQLKVDVDRNIQMRFQRHGYPFVSAVFHSILENPTIPEQIDRIGGHQNMVIIFTAGTHFKGFPLHIYIRRVINIRKAIQRLLLRSPATKVILKTENTAAYRDPIEAVSDLHGYFQYLIMNSLMKGLNIATIDAWDMTTAAATNDLHPPPVIIQNEISLLLTFLC
ncbi:NXPE family member 4-like [Ambystoma mexicanum]|uniref:NXPE family member 4-like n=1 Tax=Ambystoma mexicanum TaxID=8296 RepID=UPI0037E839BD